jgi:NADH-quinone oxidoreductase subunit M
MFPMLSTLIFLPLVGALLLLLFGKISPRISHLVGIITSALTLVVVLWMWSLGINDTGFSHIEQYDWMPAIGAAYRVGVDGISLPLVLLTALLFLLSFIFSANIKKQSRSYVILMLLLETAAMGTFTALDAILFYVFFEVSLVSMYFMIAGWGHEDRQRAAIMFFIYTLLGSLPLLLAILGMYLGSDPHTFDMRVWIAESPLSGFAAMLAFIAMLFTFAVKIPAFPLHTWLPAAHVQAPAAGSVILAGVMLKFGTYGLIRFSLQMTPEAFREAATVVLVIGVFSAIYGAFAGLAQTDLKRMIAYTSLNHMGYVIVAVAIAAMAIEPSTYAIALDGAVLQMVSHGLVTGALFFLVGMLQDRAQTRDMHKFGGLLKTVPILAWFFIIASFASLGLPGLAHFPAEFQIFLATLEVKPLASIVILGIVITAALYLKAISTVFLGTENKQWQTMQDLSPRELLTLVPLIVFIIVLGVAPSFILDVIHQTTVSLGF